MRIDNIKWHPIRLQATRVSNDEYTIERDDVACGRVRREGLDKWRSWGPRDPQDGNYFASSSHTHSSFRAAVLYRARYGIYTSSDGPQNYGNLQMIRVNAEGAWFTVIFDKGARYVYEDFTLDPDHDGKMDDRKQAHLRKVTRVADDFARENL
jgi:hypothetical protein